MAFSSELLQILVCPETHLALRVATTEQLAALNQAISRGTLTNRAGQKLTTPLAGGLVRVDGKVLYPLLDEIPMLLVDEAILLDQPGLNTT